MSKKIGLAFIVLTVVVLAFYKGLKPDYTVKDFTADELKWFTHFNKNDTVVFVSEKNEFDTIPFNKVVATSDTVRHLELGFYNINYLRVPYTFSKGSYHQSALMGDGQKRYDQAFASISKTSNGLESLEITFIGTLFNGKELKNISKINEDEYYFDSNKATYSKMGVEKRIKDFTFNTKLGILRYTDDRGIKWKRISD